MPPNESSKPRRRAGSSIEVGERFGALTVTEVGLRLPKTPTQIKKGLLGDIAALTICDCGQERLTAAGRLIQGKVHACLGCQSGRSPEEVERRRQAGTWIGGRKPKQIDTTAFEPVVAEFLRAAAVDPDYAVDICTAAARIQDKRDQWTVRKALRAHEAEARRACASSTLTSCEILNPCGTGPSCPWATPALAAIDVPPTAPGISPRRSERPQPRSGPGFMYSLEPVVQVLVEQRRAERAGRPALLDDEART